MPGSAKPRGGPASVTWSRQPRRSALTVANRPRAGLRRRIAAVSSPFRDDLIHAGYSRAAARNRVGGTGELAGVVDILKQSEFFGSMSQRPSKSASEDNP